MGKLKVFLIIIGLVFLLLLIIGILSPKETQPTPPPENKTTEIKKSRSFEMGFVPIPKQPLTTEAWIEAFTLFGDNAEILLQHANIIAEDWIAFKDNTNIKTGSIESLNFITGMANREDLDVMIVVDPLRSDREEISNLPESIGTNFGDDDVRIAFKNYAVHIAQNYKPKYLGLGSEVNTYLSKHPEDAANLISLIKETKAAIKQASPNTKITSTFQYESLLGKNDNAPEWENFNLIEPELDIVSITTYPSPWFDTPDNIPKDYYNEVKEYTIKPIIIAESGWPTSGSSNFHGSDINQKRFVEIFPGLIKDIEVEVWIWWFPHDWDGEGYPDFFKTMGLRTSDGTPKPSWNAWQEIYKL